MAYKGNRTRPPMKNDDEFDAFSKRWRKLIHWKKGQIKKVKRRYGKRARREGRKRNE